MTLLKQPGAFKNWSAFRKNRPGRIKGLIFYKLFLMAVGWYCG